VEARGGTGDGGSGDGGGGFEDTTTHPRAVNRLYTLVEGRYNVAARERETRTHRARSTVLGSTTRK